MTALPDWLDPLYDAEHFMPFEHRADLDHLLEGIALAAKT